MTTLKKLTELDADFSHADICRAIESPSNQAQEKLKAIINNCGDVDTLKAAAIKFEGINEFFPVEDCLVSIMGDDAYDEFLEENGIS